MSNQSQNNSSALSAPQESEIPSLDQILDSLGFDPWKTITATFVIPSISLIGIFFCSLSAWIFFQKKFKDPVFFYYRLLCIVYIIHLVHIIPFGLIFSPRYFTKINTYFTSLFNIYCSCFINFLYHFEETLQMAILLTRMKIYNSFVNKHFSSKPWVISLALFLTCFCIDIITPFSFKVESVGEYFYFESDGSKIMSTFYIYTLSEFSSTLIGRILLAIAVPFLGLLMSIIVGIALNLVSVSLYRTYIKERREKSEAYTRAAYHHKKNVDEEDEIQVVTSPSKKLTQKEIDENKAESNMFKMALTLCSISILSRFLIIFNYIYFFFFNSFSATLTLLIFGVSMHSLVLSLSINVFYFFNKMFRQEFRKRILKKENVKK